MTIKTDEMEIDRHIPDGQECDHCEQLAVVTQSLIRPGAQTGTGYLCQDCLDTIKRDLFEERYGDGFDR
jgi:hypothetical protein